MSKIKQKENEKAIEALLKGDIKQARKNLEDKGINASGRLSSRFMQSYNVGENSIEGTITGEDYAKFIDLGVKGVKSGKSLGGFKFKSKGGKRGLKGMPPPKAFDKWNIIRGRAGRDEKGKFLTRKQLNFKTAVGVFNYGIKPSKFFSSAFEDEFNKLPKELIEAYALDVETFMEFILNE